MENAPDPGIQSEAVVLEHIPGSPSRGATASRARVAGYSAVARLSVVSALTLALALVAPIDSSSNSILFVRGQLSDAIWYAALYPTAIAAMLLLSAMLGRRMISLRTSGGFLVGLGIPILLLFGDVFPARAFSPPGEVPGLEPAIAIGTLAGVVTITAGAVSLIRAREAAAEL